MRKLAPIHQPKCYTNTEFVKAKTPKSRHFPHVDSSLRQNGLARSSDTSRLACRIGIRFASMTPSIRWLMRNARPRGSLPVSDNPQDRQQLLAQTQRGAGAVGTPEMLIALLYSTLNLYSKP